MAGKFADSHTRENIPNGDVLLIVARRQQASVWAESDIDDRAVIASEIANDLTSFNVPEPHGSVVHGRSQQLAVGTKGNGIDPVVANPRETLDSQVKRT